MGHAAANIDRRRERAIRALGDGWVDDFSVPTAPPPAAISGVCVRGEDEGELLDDALEGDALEGPERWQRGYVLVPTCRPIVESDGVAQSAARLGAMLGWIHEGEDSTEVAQFVHELLRLLGELDAAMSLLNDALRASASAPLQTAGESFERTVGIWRASLADHVDELTLFQRDSLSGWSSLPAYSKGFALAFIGPALASVREWAIAVDGAGPCLAAALQNVEASVLELNSVLERAANPGARA
jgi:hypothetical protein